MPDPAKLFTPGSENNTNIASIRVTAHNDFKKEAFRRLLHAAVELDSDPMISPAPKVKRKPWPMPEFFKKALKRNRAASNFFRSLAPTYQREYLVWLTMAKLPETRAHRLKETLATLAAGRKWAQRKSN